MKKLLIILFSLIGSLLIGQRAFISHGGILVNSGNLMVNISTPTPTPTGSQIIADHTVVSDYDIIPQRWIDSVKTMWVSYAGESHSEGIRDGLTTLESSEATYAVSATESGTPEAATLSNLRISRATWGDVNNASGWIYGYGEEDWFTSETAINRTKAGLTYINTNGPELYAFAFGWCWDLGISFPDYISATKEYIEYCADSISTKVFFTTGTVDIYDGENGYTKHLGYELIRDSVANDSTRILFDYADILCYNDGATTPNTTTYGANTYPFITSTNLTPTIGSHHISEAGTVRLGKAMWWMLARIAGWDGEAAAAPVSLGDDILDGMGAFTASTGWTATNWTISGGTANCDATNYAALATTSLSEDWQVSTNYRIQFDVATSGGGTDVANIAFTYQGGSGFDLIDEDDYLTGSYSFDFTTPATIPNQGLEIYNMTDSDGAFTLDNLTIQEIL